MLELVPGNPEQVNENQEIYLNILLIMCAKSAKGGFNNNYFCKQNLYLSGSIAYIRYHIKYSLFTSLN